jgi:hypothetical protein
MDIGKLAAVLLVCLLGAALLGRWVLIPAGIVALIIVIEIGKDIWYWAWGGKEE